MGKVALITGASGGIGSAIAERFAADGYSLYLHYYRGEEAVIGLCDRLLIKASPDQMISCVQADLSSSQGHRLLLEQIHHPIETIIHNSGSGYVGLVTDMDESDVQKMVQLHVTSPFLLTKGLLPAMISDKHGKIIVVSSVWGLVGASTEVLYSTVKGALNSFVKALAKEVAPSGISVNGIAPGAVSTKMLDHLTEEEKAALQEEIPMGRFGKPEEIADLAAFLASEKASYINGEIVSINGAWY
ncbi:MAG TPA: SDR family oxidoreductase [Bacillales bacterium]|nr:SDR family oxidoreductase [Bacillales bacterium]